jgi:hypothetical protein
VAVVGIYSVADRMERPSAFVPSMRIDAEAAVRAYRWSKLTYINHQL